MKIVTIIGARPQFIKYALVSRELRRDHQDILVHTGQHYDPEMSDIFFQELQIPRPDYNLGVGSGSHAGQTGKILKKAEDVLLKEKPDLVFVYGDTNSTLAGALAAVKLHIPVAHVEAGPRSYDRSMPEEVNRVVTDHISTLLICPTERAVKNLAAEGITKGVHLVGDVMADALSFSREMAEKTSLIIKTLDLNDRNYGVLTIHRPGNTDSPKNLANIVQAVGKSGMTVVFPVHPRTRKNLLAYGLRDTLSPNIIVTEPLGYLDMIRLMSGAEKILTDSGGMQKEAYILGVPCITLRENTEWVETMEGGWNILAGSDPAGILNAIRTPGPRQPQEDLFPTGAAEKIRAILESIKDDRNE